MDEFKDDELDEVEEDIVVMTDDEGNEYYYREDVIIPVGEKRFAVLVPIDPEEEGEDPAACDCGCDDCCDTDIDVFIARIDTDEKGEDVYVDPTDEEFDEVRKAYEELLAEEENEA